jgi:hypothetical protein
MSDLEDIADRLRALARDAGPLSAELEAVARELLAIGREAESLSRLGFGGAQVLGLITQAVTHARNGADAVAQVGAKGLDWADHLANRASGSISASPRGVGAAEWASPGEQIAETQEVSGAITSAASPVAGERLSKQMAYQEAAAVFTSSGGLSSEVVTKAQRIVSGRKLGNADLVKRLTADGSSIDYWAKYTTRSFRCPSGTFQVHFYMNKEANVIITNTTTK